MNQETPVHSHPKRAWRRLFTIVAVVLPAFVAGISMRTSFADGLVRNLAVLLAQRSATVGNANSTQSEQVLATRRPAQGARTASTVVTTTNTFVTAPNDLPAVRVSGIGTTAPGYVFTAAFRGAAQSRLLILDDQGEVVYFRDMPADVANLPNTDFKRQPNGQLTYFNGAEAAYKVMNSAYEIVDSWSMVGYPTDEHDLQILPNGNALLMSYNPISMDLSAYGGITNAVLVDLVIQEQNPSKSVVFEWSALNHIPITDSYHLITFTVFDPYHGNAFELDMDGNLLLSNRHTSDIVKINRATGGIMWRLGGRSNEFVFVNDGGFSLQHDIRRLPNGHITLFDNGNARVDFQRELTYSRAVEYELDEVNKIITRVWEYRNSPDIYGRFMGNAQRLPNGNTMIGWGGPSSVGTEVTPGGQEALELSIDRTAAGQTYRWFRFPWVGRPSTTPTLALKGGRLYFSWNGATEISAYRVEGAPNQGGEFRRVTTELRTGFETSTTLPVNTDLCVFRVMPIEKGGAETRFSNTVYNLENPACQRNSVVLPMLIN
jgi:hypothetical protein